MKAGVSISPTRAEGYPFVTRYPYRMLRRATWLKAASCVLSPDILFLFLSFFSISDATRDKIFPPNVIDSHFSGNGGGGKFPANFIHQFSVVQCRNCLSLFDDYETMRNKLFSWVQNETRSLLIFLCNSSMEINEISAQGDSVGKFRSLERFNTILADIFLAFLISKI